MAYADDVTLTQKGRQKFERMVQAFFTVTRKYGITVSCEKKKTRAMHVRFGGSVVEEEPPLLVFSAEGVQQIEWTRSKRLLGPQMEADHTLGTHYDITTRTKAAMKAFWSRKLFFFSKELTYRTKGIILRTYVLPALLYGTHTWVMTNKRMTKIRQAWRKMCRVAAGRPNRYLLLTKDKYRHWQLQQLLGVQTAEVPYIG